MLRQGLRCQWLPLTLKPLGPGFPARRTVSELLCGGLGGIQMLGKSDDWQVKGQAPKGLGWAPPAAYGIVGKHSMDFWLASEDLPLPESRVTLRSDGSIKLAVQPDNNSEGVAR